jgi:F-type H+-transporting ATPase subunit epsilon
MPTLRLEILTIERKLFDDEVNMVIAPGAEGVLGILPRHTPLLTALTYGELQVKKEGAADQFFAIGGGFMEVQPDHVIVMADAAERADEIDVDRAEAARRRAETFLKKAKTDTSVDLARAEAALRRSITRIKAAQRRRRKERPSRPMGSG